MPWAFPLRLEHSINSMGFGHTLLMTVYQPLFGLVRPMAIACDMATNLQALLQWALHYVHLYQKDYLWMATAVTCMLEKFQELLKASTTQLTFALALPIY